jgi:cyanophycinase
MVAVVHRIVQYFVQEKRKQSMTTSARGKIALVGAGEYLPVMAAVDQALLADLEETPQVVVIPTAAVPDGPATTERWAKMGVDHFSQLGVHVEPLMLRTRDDANSPHIVTKLTSANFVYFSGGKPHYLLETLKDTLAWEAIKNIFGRGGVVAGCSAGAMVMGGVIFRFPQFWQTQPALGLVPDIAVIPHFNELPATLSQAIDRIDVKETVVGIDAATALVWGNTAWTVQGHGTVTVFQEPKKVQYSAGQHVTLAPLTS